MNGSVVLVHAPIELDATVKVPVPLGPVYLGAVLKAHGVPVSFFDFHHDGTDWGSVESAVAASRPCLIGFSCATGNIHRVLHLSDRLLERFPHATVVLGGPHVTHIWEPYVTDRRFVIRDEGEYPLLKLAEFVLHGQGTLDAVPSLAYAVEGQVHSNPVDIGPFDDIDAIPFPDYTLLADKAFYIPAAITSRGCRHRCFFCSEGARRRPYRARSVGNVEAELHGLKEFYAGRMPYLVFHDDTFTASAPRVYEMCDAIDRVFPDKSRFGFCCEARVDVLAEHPELVARLKEAGMISMQIGIESGNQDFLDQMNKHIRREQIEEVVSCCERTGVAYLAGNFIFGLPHQTPDDIEGEIAFAKRLGELAPARIELTAKALMPYPGTEYRVNAEKWGLSLLDEELVTGRTANASFVETASLSRDEIERSCRRFMVEVGDHLLEKAAPALTPRLCKEQVIMAAETSQRTYALTRLCCFTHIARTLLLRRRSDHRFLHEVPEENVPDCAPVAVPDNVIGRSGAGYRVNPGSPLEFDLDEAGMGYYRCFVGRLTFAEIARRRAREQNVPEAEAYRFCLDVYAECEDSLAAIALI